MIRRTPLSPGFRVEIHSPTRDEVDRSVAAINLEVRRVAVSAGAVVIDPMDFLCDQRVCPAVSGDGEPMYHDFAHLTPSYVRAHVSYLDRTLYDPRDTYAHR